MIRLLTVAASTIALAASPAAAQSMHGMQMPAMDMSTPMPAKKKPAGKAAPPRNKPATKQAPTGTAVAPQAMPGMAMPDTGAMPGMTMPPQTVASAAPSGTDLPAGNAPPPPVPGDHYADRTFPGDRMRPARAMMHRENGGETVSQVMVNLAEVQIHDGRNGYRWDGEARFGGDFNRLVVKSEGEGTFGKGVDTAEVQALYSRAISPYFDLQAGGRHDFQPSPTQTFATLGIEGLAPYRIETEAALFLSTKGDLLARAEAWYDERITQRLILQPRAELNFAAQDVPEDRLGSGLTGAELGLRLRYEISRRLAPYVGLSYAAKTGRTATFARRGGNAPHAMSLVLGLRTWF